MTYQDFLARKVKTWTGNGLPMTTWPEPLFDWQVEIVRWALGKGRAAIWADTGLGKTAMQLTWADNVARATGGRVLILTPLAVGAQTVREASKFGLSAAMRRDDARPSEPIHVLNYEQLHHVNQRDYQGVVLDESSILKAFSGTTKRQLVSTFKDTPYRLCCTATPAPNDHLELGNHCEFLGVMRSAEMIMRWFINDPMEAGAYRLKAHAVGPFWRWVASWAVSLRNPSDMGYPGEAFVLPPLQIHHESVGYVDLEPPDGQLFDVAASSATGLHRSLRASSAQRAAAAAEIVRREPDERWLIWAHTNYDADAFRALLPECVEVRGDDTAAQKEARLEAFSLGQTRILLTKPSVAGFGMNWQHCARVLFLGPSYSYEEWYQAIRRTWRYGQTRPVEVYLMSADNDHSVVNTVLKKETAHRTLQSAMVEASREELQPEIRPMHSSVLARTSGDGWTLVTGDCVQAMPSVLNESIGLSVFSPPFANLYIYSDALEDMGNSTDYTEFWSHFSYLASELQRVTIPGRLCAIHCKDLPRYKGRDGSAGLYDFPGECIRSMIEAGWTYHSRVTIWKDPVIEMQRTKNHGLLYKQLRKDSCASRMGMADFVLAFRKWDGAEGDFPDPVPHDRSDFPLSQWQAWASPVWSDIRQTRVLQYQDAKASEDERHICPLQLDVIERCLSLWSNPGDLVLSPFAGIGSEGYEAIRLGRRFIGIELKPGYAAVAAKNLTHAETLRTQGALFPAAV